MPQIKLIPIEEIKVGEYAVRLQKEDEDIEDLGASIRRIGIVVPLHVYCKGGEYYLVAGHRRYVAAKRVGLETVPCIVLDSEQTKSSEVAFAENFFRRDLSPVELACAVEDCITKKIQTAEQLAASMHRTKHWVQAQLDIMGWPADVLQAVHLGWLSVSAASNIALVNDDNYRDFLLKTVHDSGATARTTAAWLQAWRAQLPQEQAVEQPPVDSGKPVTPALPQAPCVVCGQMFRTDGLAMVMVCTTCLGAVRGVGIQR